MISILSNIPKIYDNWIYYNQTHGYFESLNISTGHRTISGKKSSYVQRTLLRNGWGIANDVLNLKRKNIFIILFLEKLCNFKVYELPFTTKFIFVSCYSPSVQVKYQWNSDREVT